eukprot:3452676-Rhodomonas_salina.1
MQETAFLVQFVLKRQFLVFDFAVYTGNHVSGTTWTDSDCEGTSTVAARIMSQAWPGSPIHAPSVPAPA